MNSGYGKILWLCFVTLLASMVALTAITLFIRLHIARAAPDRLNVLFLEQTIDAYQTGGPERLKAELAHINGHLPDRHYLLDASGKDLASGEDRSALLRKARHDLPAVPYLIPPHSAVLRSGDRKYWFLVVYSRQFDFRPIIPYHALLLVAVAVLGGALAANLA